MTTTQSTAFGAVTGTNSALVSAAAALVSAAHPSRPRIAELFAALTLDYTAPWAVISA